MRKSMYILLLIFVASVLNGAGRMIEIGKQFASFSGDELEIVLAPEGCKTTGFAAKELGFFLGKVLSAKVPVVSAPTKGKMSIYVGISKYSRAAGMDESKLFRDAFMIRHAPAGIYILGRDDASADPEKVLPKGIWAQYFERGTLFAVYDWLERFAGVRFYFPGELGTIVPNQKKLDVCHAEIFDFPDFPDRKVSQYHGSWPGKPASDRAFPEKNLAAYRYRYETRYIPNNHGLARLGYLLRFGKKHPEYFALMNNGKRHNDISMAHAGSLCYSSGIAEEIYQDAKSFLLGEAPSKRGVLYTTRRDGRYLEKNGIVVWDPSGFQKGYFSIMPPDGYSRCYCKMCGKKFGTGENYASEFMWSFVSDIANRLKKEKIPGYLTMMVYRPYRNIPKCEIPDNVLVTVSERGPWSYYNAGELKASHEEVRAWSRKLGRKVSLWNYLCKMEKTGFPGIPSPTPGSIVPYYREIAHCISGAYMESETDRYINNYLAYYIFGKYAWNHTIDVKAIIAEHHKLMFGDAAPEMKKLFDLFEEVWLQKIVGRQVDTDLGPMAVPPTDLELWTKIYPADKIAEIRTLFDRAAKRCARDPKASARVRLFRTEWLEPLYAARETYISQTDAVRSFRCSPAHPAYLIPFQKGKNMLSREKTVSTKVTASLEGDHLQFIFDCEEPFMDRTVASRRKYDDLDLWKDNSVEVFLNPSGDRKVYYQLILSSAGSFTDQKWNCHGTKQQGDIKWKSEAEYRIIPNSKGYQAVISIPRKNLPGFRREGFPVNFSRNRILSGFQCLYTWSPFVRDFHDLENFGTLFFQETAKKNLFTNGDFSEATKGGHIHGWGVDKRNTGENVILDEEIFFSGPASVRLSNAEGCKDYIYLTQSLKNLKPDTEYRFRCCLMFQDVKPLDKQGGITVNVFTTKNLWFPKNRLTGTSNGWIRQEYRFRTSPELHKKYIPYVRLRLFRATGTVWFDDVTLEEVGK